MAYLDNLLHLLPSHHPFPSTYIVLGAWQLTVCCFLPSRCYRLSLVVSLGRALSFHYCPVLPRMCTLQISSHCLTGPGLSAWDCACAWPESEVLCILLGQLWAVPFAFPAGRTTFHYSLIMRSVSLLLAVSLPFSPSPSISFSVLCLFLAVSCHTFCILSNFSYSAYRLSFSQQHLAFNAPAPASPPPPPPLTSALRLFIVRAFVYWTIKTSTRTRTHTLVTTLSFIQVLCLIRSTFNLFKCLVRNPVGRDRAGRGEEGYHLSESARLASHVPWHRFVSDNWPGQECRAKASNRHLHCSNRFWLWPLTVGQQLRHFFVNILR